MRKEVLEYFRKWGGNELQFTEMLMKKAYCAKINKIKIMAGGKMRTGNELEEMLIIADDMACERLLIK